MTCWDHRAEFGYYQSSSGFAQINVNSSSSIVLTWLIALVTGGGLILLDIMYVAFINYHDACIAQIIDHKIRPKYNCSRSYGARIAISIQTTMLLTYGYYAFHSWGVKAFFQNYEVQIVGIILYLGWKLFRSLTCKDSDWSKAR